MSLTFWWWVSFEDLIAQWRYDQSWILQCFRWQNFRAWNGYEGKGGIVAINSSFLLFALRSLEIEPLEKKIQKKSVSLQVVFKGSSSSRKWRQEGFQGSRTWVRFLSQTLNTHCMNLVKPGTIALLNFLLLFPSVFKMGTVTPHIAHIKRGVSITAKIAKPKSNTGNPTPEPSV